MPTIQEDRYTEIEKNGSDALNQSLIVRNDFPLRAYFDTVQNYDREVYNIYSRLKAIFDTQMTDIYQGVQTSDNDVLKLILENYLAENFEVEKARFAKYHDEYVDGRDVLNEDPLVKTRLDIGPLTFKSTVQAIQIIEPKAVEEFATSRRQGSMLIPSGNSRPIINISFVFPDLDSINNALRPLIALFKICPITVVSNNILSSTLGHKTLTPRITTLIRKVVREIKDDGSVQLKLGEIINTINSDDQLIGLVTSVTKRFISTSAKLMGHRELSRSLDLPSAASKATEQDILDLLDSTELRTRSLEEYRYVPVALTNLSISTHPEIPTAFIVNLGMVRVSAAAYTKDGILWRDERNNPTQDPKKAFYLKVALNKYIEKHIPTLTKNDLSENETSLAKKQFILKSDILRLQTTEQIKLDVNDNNYIASDGHKIVSVGGLQCSISNHFSFPSIIGKEYPTAQHIGISNINLSASMICEGDEFVEDINAFKRRLDNILRSELYEERIYGISVESSITKLLTADNFYFTSLSTRTDANNPTLRYVDISLAESKLDFVNDQIITVRSGSYNADDLRKFWHRLWTFARSGFNRIFTFGLAKEPLEGDPIKILTDGLVKLSKPADDQSSSLKVGDYLTYKAILILFGISPSHGFDRYSHGSSDGSTNPLGDSLIHRNGLLTTSLILDALTNHNTGYANSDFFRTSYEKVYDEITNKFAGKSPVAALLEGLVLKYARPLGEKNPFGILDETAIEAFAKKIKEVFHSPIYEKDQDKNLYDIAIRLLLMTTNKDTQNTPYYLLKFGILPQDDFIDAMFDALYFRPSPWDLFTDIVDSKVIDSSRMLLLREFEDAGDLYLANLNDLNDPKKKDERYKPRRRSFSVYDENLIEFQGKIENTYSDYSLPTFYELFGAAWPLFAPTYDDVGQQAPLNKRMPLGDGLDITELDVQSLTFASAEDIVPPSIFFYHSKSEEKKDVREKMKEYSSLDIDNNEKYNTKLDFDIHEVDAEGAEGAKIIEPSPGTLANQIKASLADTDSSARRKAAQYTDAVTQFLKDHFSKEEIDSIVKAAFDSQVSSEDFQKLLYDDQGFVKTHDIIGRDGQKRKATLMFGINYGGMLVPKYKRASQSMSSDLIRIGIQRFPEEHAHVVFNALDSGHTSPLNRLSNDRSAMKDYRKFMIDKMINSMPDNRYNPIRAYPTFRFYLLDEDEKKFIHYDVFTGINAVQSIDITTDKHDPAVAQIVIADPLRIIQNQFFEDPDGNNDVIILDKNRRNRNRDFKNNIKVKIGRPIQIRMGYSHHPDGLDIVFTGRITEIIPGDIITIIAQSWKAECFAHEVQLKLSQGLNPFNSSVKDLVTAAIRESDVKGLGEVYSPIEADTLSAFGYLQRGTSFNHAQKMTGGTSLDLIEFIEEARGKDVVGIDTRLKNIWVPDAPNRLAYYLKHPHLYAREWIVPMQPLWNILQEAARHTIGYICDVVPYDGRATLFFGKPDQPYFFTEWDPREFSRWRKLASRTLRENITKIHEELFSKFFASKYFDNDNVEVTQVTSRRDVRSARVFYNIVDGPIIRVITIFRNVTTTKSIILKTFDPSYTAAINILRADVSLVKDPLHRDDRGTGRNFLRLKRIINEISKDKNVFKNKMFNLVIPLILYDANPDLDYIIEKTEPAIVDLIAALLLNANLEDIRAHFQSRSEFFRAILGPWSNDNPTPDSLKAFIENVKRTTSPELSDVLLASITNIPESDTKLKRAKDLLGLLREAQESISNRWFTGQRSKNSIFSDDYISVSWGIHNGVIDIAGGYIRTSLSFDNLDSKITEIQAQVSREENERVKRLSPENQDVDPAIRSLWRTNIQTKFAETDPDEFQHTTIEEYIDRHATKIKLLIIFMAQFLRNSETKLDQNEIKKAMNNIKNFSMAPSMTTFRKYHLITSDTDIISNDIVATTKQMANTIIIQHPQKISDQNWMVNEQNAQFPVFRSAPRYWPSKDMFHETGLSFSPGLAKEIKKIRTVSEMNVDMDDKAAIVALSNMAISMRPMYRGSLTILGRDIRPWHICIINDAYTDMEGPIDVERVTHHFSPSVGWVTTINPHLMCHANPESMILDVAQAEAAYNFWYDIAGSAFNTLLIASLFFAPGAGKLVSKTAGGLMSTVVTLLGVNFASRTKTLAARATAASAGQRLAGIFSRGNLIRVGERASLVKSFAKRWIGKAALGYMAFSAARALWSGAHEFGTLQNMCVTYKDNNRPKLAPVVFMPLRLYGRPFTAGVDTAEALYTTPGWTTFASYAKVQDAKRKALRPMDTSSIRQNIDDVLRQ